MNTEQKKAAAAAERRAKVRKLAKEVSAMGLAERIELATRAGIRTIEGRELSAFNQCLLIAQDKNVTVVGGFRQWKAAGRIVRKGERALAIWIPCQRKSEDTDTDTGETVEDTYFSIGSVFDVAQTEPLDATEVAA